MKKRTKSKKNPKAPVRGMFLHRASGQFIAYIGNHKTTKLDRKSNAEVVSRHRTTHYFGFDPTAACAKFYAIKAEWERVVAAERKRDQVKSIIFLASG